MSDLPEKERYSVPLSPDLITDPDEIAKAEARNSLRQFDSAMEMVEYHLDPERPFKLRPSALLRLQGIALEGISHYAGITRPAGIGIAGSQHKPVDAFLVPQHMEELCDYVNDKWNTASAIHLAAYVMWRLNWIHPFVDGNGRTSRTASYLILCTKLGYRLPGSNTIPDQISANKKPYYDALEAADTAYLKGTIDVRQLEDLLGNMLANQLYKVHQDALGTSPVTSEEPDSNHPSR